MDTTDRAVEDVRELEERVAVLDKALEISVRDYSYSHLAYDSNNEEQRKVFCTEIRGRSIMHAKQQLST